MEQLSSKSIGALTRFQRHSTRITYALTLRVNYAIIDRQWRFHNYGSSLVIFR
jgi:hypothetical protein